MSDLMARMTERQRTAWPEAVAELGRYTLGTVSEDPYSYDWTIIFEPESRPGRGHMLNALWCDGEHFGQIRMDVYGYPSVSVAELSWLHNSSDEECGCDPCEQEREAQGE